MPSSVVSKNNIPVRLTDERWAHIIEEHGELDSLQLGVLETVANPEYIFAGDKGELLAVRTVSEGKWLIVVYRELETDGFIITAFVTRRANWFTRRERRWP